jgi:hypothetical protein
VAWLYADENVPLPLVVVLRDLGHDILTVHEAGQGNKRIADPAVVAFAHALGRAVLTFNRSDFIRLHHQDDAHSGIIVCRQHPDRAQLAARIDAAIRECPNLAGQLIKVNRPEK